jgi:subtilisin family serine protease
MAPENNSKLLYVAAAGNGRPSDPNNLSSTPRGFNIDTDPQTVYPAAFTHGNLITVGALNSAGSGPASFSNFGARSVDIFAPGELIASTGPADGYTSNDGTSFASPLVAGAASLLWSRHPSLKSAAVKCAIMASATRIPSLIARKTNRFLLLGKPIAFSRVSPKSLILGS